MILQKENDFLDIIKTSNDLLEFQNTFLKTKNFQKQPQTLGPRRYYKLRRLNQLRPRFHLGSDLSHLLINFFDPNSSSESE